MQDNRPSSGESTRLAPGDTLLGQLQRGRGAGFLRALGEDPAAVHPLLIDCMTHDPRCDSQVEDRADYYARLALATQMDPSRLEHYLRTTPDDRFGPDTFLAIETLGRLAQLGSERAGQILIDYISYGPKWDAALQGLAGVPSSHEDDDLAKRICARFQTGQQMDDSSVYGLFGSHDALDALWESLSDRYPCIARLVSQAREIELERRRGGPTHPDYSAMRNEELLAMASVRNWRRIQPVLLSRLEPAGVPTYETAFSSSNPFAWWLAFECLTALERIEPWYETILGKAVTYLQFLARSSDRRARWGRRPVQLMLEQMPPAMTLPLAREWFQSDEWVLRSIAEDILEEHATLDDIPRVRAALSAALADPNPYSSETWRVCSMLDILALFPDIGPLSEVEMAFIQTACAYGRRRAALAMQVNAPEWFGGTYAYECMWDSDEETRQIGCECVSLDVPGAHERLQELANDPLESDDLRQAAAARLVAGC